MRFQLVTAPASEPVSLPDVKTALQIDSTARDARINDLIAMAREEVEADLLRQLVTATWKLYLDGFGDEILIRKCPVQSIVAIEYNDTNGVLQTVDEDVYSLDVFSEPARLYEAYGQSWPTGVLLQPNSAFVTFVAGYGDPADVPQAAKEMIYLLIRRQLDGWDTSAEYEAKKLKLAWTV